MQPSPSIRQFVAFVIALVTTMGIASAQAASVALIPLDRPFLFGYGTWTNKALIADGIVSLRSEGMTPAGGAGVNLNLDLSQHPENSPGLRVLVTKRNTLKTLKLMLTDTDGKTASWFYALSNAVVDMPTDIVPRDGAPLSKPNEAGKTGAPNLAKIMQFQLQGDWGGSGPVDVQVLAINSVVPDANLLAARKAKDDRDSAALAQALRDRLADREKYKTLTPQSPRVAEMYAAAPDVLAIRIETGTVILSSETPYVAQPGDVAKPQKSGPQKLARGGKEIGWLIGPKSDGFVPFEGYTGDKLLTVEADDVTNYHVRSADDAQFANSVVPVSVSRKSKPYDWQQPSGQLAMGHVIYLKLPSRLKPGSTYVVSYDHLNVRPLAVPFKFDPATVRTETVHINQIGFRPDDPVKRAFVSVWMGSPGGGYSLPDSMSFSVVDDVTGKVGFEGKSSARWPADKAETMASTRNFNSTDVVTLDFSPLTKPGRYRVVLDGIGCSYPFDIKETAWRDAFYVSMKGLYNERSGVPLGPPYTAFVRPADFRIGLPDSMPITQSTYSNLDGGDPGKGLVKGDTGVPVPEAWGAYHDAGDWNPRRITHLLTTTLWQVELAECYPAFAKTIKLNIPQTSPACDVLNEARFGLDLWRRLQKPDGGIPFGIETDGDPSGGEVSWKQSMPAYVFAPDVVSTYQYVTLAARLSKALEGTVPAEASTYRSSALRAMAWAEADRAKRMSAGTWAKLGHNVLENRSLAALSLLWLTGDAKWHTLFKEDTGLTNEKQKPFYGSFEERETAFLYARLPAALTDPKIKQTALADLLADADGALNYQANNAWQIPSDDQGKPLFIGFFSTPHGSVSLVRAYYLTHDRKYLAGAVAGCGFSAGANPNNMVYTSGLGANPVRHPFNMDSRNTGQPPPVGLTVYGNVDLQRWGDQNWISWPITYYLNDACKPSPYDWPTTEAYWDMYFYPALTEFCIDQTMGPSAFVWGMLAGRDYSGRR
ncbi:MAG TPA: cellulase N-terminal Ig-like domain-containing protein [Capsulimonadaceae bacterium]|jgi:endoglucanase